MRLNTQVLHSLLLLQVLIKTVFRTTNMQKTLNDIIKTLKSENLKLNKEKDAYNKEEVLRLNLEFKTFKNQNENKKDSEAQINNIEKKLISELSFIQDENTLKVEDITVQVCIFN